MKKNILMLLIALIALLPSCKKNEILQKDIDPTSLNKNAKQQGFNLDSYEVGGTIGCAIRLTDPSSSGYRDNDAYDSCMDDMLAGRNTLGNLTMPGKPPMYPAPECLPCMVPSTFKIDLMQYYWALLDVPEPSTEQDYVIARNKLTIFNTIIAAIFTNSNGELEIPEDRLTRRDQLLAYAGTLPVGLVDYVDFVYGKYFSLEPVVGAKLFRVLDANGFQISYKSYGVIIGDVAMNL
ncbi:hypothetical protein [Pedobacter nototheniae]|uniref:hypothetical protein n=1 Tax=Pedobacter nototheniae TaxID=2488994 RepID=UPI00292E8307|nr:hypothetical protein [Pedobacter nototheniae]